MSFDRFARLDERKDQAAGTLSGGEQQMLAMGRALMAQPRLLLLDEPSLGLAPLITDEIFAHRSSIVAFWRDHPAGGTNAARALSASHKAFLMAGGRIVAAGTQRRICSITPSCGALSWGLPAKRDPKPAGWEQPA
jgi:phenylacetate-CoA ligase